MTSKNRLPLNLNRPEPSLEIYPAPPTIDPVLVCKVAEINKKFWASFFHANRKVKLLTAADWSYAGHLAGNWDTCACGSINDGLPRRSFMDWEPRDRLLSHLGTDFYTAIRNQHYLRARRLFSEIHKRAVVVLAEIASGEACND